MNGDVNQNDFLKFEFIENKFLHFDKKLKYRDDEINRLYSQLEHKRKTEELINCSNNEPHLISHSQFNKATAYSNFRLDDANTKRNLLNPINIEKTNWNP